MNITYTEIPLLIMAKTCGHNKTSKRVTYAFVDSYHSLCIDKKEIIYSYIIMKLFITIFYNRLKVNHTTYI